MTIPSTDASGKQVLPAAGHQTAALISAAEYRALLRRKLMQDILAVYESFHRQHDRYTACGISGMFSECDSVTDAEKSPAVLKTLLFSQKKGTNCNINIIIYEQNFNALFRLQQQR